MNTFPFNTVSVTVTVLLAFRFINATTLAPENELRFLGSVGNKSYYAYDISKMPWLYANEYCHINKMQLATVKSKAQVDFLRKAAVNLKTMDCYWTAGKDSQRPSQFAWSLSGEGKNVNNCLISPFVSNIAISCLCFTPFPVPKYKGVNCTVKNAILCEKYIVEEK